MPSSELACGQAGRRRHLFNHPRWNGADFLEVDEARPALCVHFFGAIPSGIAVANVRIEGGRRVRGIKVLAVAIERAGDADQDDCLRIVLDRIGDFSTYRLCFVDATPTPVGTGAPTQATAPVHAPFPGLDPRYACLDFRFRLDCAADLDCADRAACPAPVLPAPEIDYLARDYASLRQMMLDRMTLTMPGWTEKHVPDLGVTLVEVLAYTADYLSYYQDAVATEAYLDTARQRISVRRHVRLVDYRLHEGCNARTWLTLDADGDLGPLPLDDVFFITDFPELAAHGARVLSQEALAQYAPEAYEVFEPLARRTGEQLTVRAAHGAIRLHTWGDGECCLPAGATRATLLDGPPWAEGRDDDDGGRVLDLQPGDVLILEEVRGATTGAPADADLDHRHAVLLTRVMPAHDGLLRQPVLEIEWAQGDALPFSLCLSARLPAQYDCARIGDVSIARGNVVLVDHGRRAGFETFGPVPADTQAGECGCDGSVIETRSVPAPLRPVLQRRDPTFRVPFQAAASAPASATAMLQQDPRAALPDLTLCERAPAQQEQGGQGGIAWQARHDLLDSGPGDAHFVVEMDDERRAHLRFGDGALGRRPAVGAVFDARYRVGAGPAGNLGRDVIRHMVYRPGLLDGAALTVRNPLAAVGGIAPEAVAEAKLFAPGAFRKQRQRAVTAADYAQLAGQHPSVQRAAADLAWTGSWYAARVAIDPFGTEQLAPALASAVEGALHRYRRIGHDLAVVQAHYVPVALTLKICVLADFTRGAVKAAVLRVLGLAGGRGLFHPDQLSFGDGLYVSRIVAAVAAVDGVESVTVLRLRRLDVPDDPMTATAGAMPERDAALADGLLPFGPMEIARLDNDPDFPENGVLTLILGGGR